MKGTWPWHNPLVPAHHKGLRRYGLRDTPCAVCGKLFRKADIDERGWCCWCVYDQQQLLDDRIALDSSLALE